MDGFAVTYTSAEKHADATREIKLRQKVYDRLVNAGSLSREVAKKRIEIMTEIAEDYRVLMLKERLFDEDPIQPTRSKKDRDNARTARDDGSDRVGEAAASEPLTTGATQTDQG